MADVRGPRTVGAALEALARWREQEEAENEKNMVEVDGELSNLRQTLQQLKEQIEALVRYRQRLATRRGLLAAETVARGHEEIFAALTEQQATLAERARLVHAAVVQQAASLQKILEEPQVASLLDEYRTFRQKKDQLLDLPGSYRDAILGHHERVVDRLKAIVEKIDGRPAEVDAPPLTLDAIVTVDPPEGPAELAILLLPVTEETHSRWSHRNDDLQTWVAARVVQGLYEAARELQLSNPLAVYGGHRGLLAIELDLTEAPPDADLVAVMNRHIDRILRSAPELVAAKVQMRAQRVPVDTLLPPDEETVEEASHA